MEATLFAAPIALALEAGSSFQWTTGSNLVLHFRLRQLTVINPFQEILVREGGS